LPKCYESLQSLSQLISTKTFSKPFFSPNHLDGRLSRFIVRPQNLNNPTYTGKPKNNQVIKMSLPINQIIQGHALDILTGAAWALKSIKHIST